MRERRPADARQQNRGSPQQPAARKRRPRQPGRHRDKCITPSGASPSGPASCARRTGRAIRMNIGRAGPSAHAATFRPSSRQCTPREAMSASERLYRNEKRYSRDLGDIDPPHQQGVIRTLRRAAQNDGRRRGAASTAGFKAPSLEIDPSPPRRCGGRSGAAEGGREYYETAVVGWFVATGDAGHREAAPERRRCGTMSTAFRAGRPMRRRGIGCRGDRQSRLRRIHEARLPQAPELCWRSTGASPGGLLLDPACCWERRNKEGV